MISPETIEKIKERMALAHVYEEDLDESFILGSGPGGQKVNKTSSTVRLHIPPGGNWPRKFWSATRPKFRNGANARKKSAARNAAAPGCAFQQKPTDGVSARISSQYFIMLGESPPSWNGKAPQSSHRISSEGSVRAIASVAPGLWMEEA